LLPMRSMEIGMANAWTFFIESLFCRTQVQLEWCSFHMFQATRIVQVHSKRRCCLRLFIDVTWGHQIIPNHTCTERCVTVKQFEHKHFQKQSIWRLNLWHHTPTDISQLFTRAPWF
jgi:hypothetical protein